MSNSVDPDQTVPIGAVCSVSTLFASIINSSVILGNYLQQTPSADDIFKCIFFPGALRVKENCEWQITHTAAETKVYSVGDDVYKNLMYSFTLQRKSLYVMIHVMVPVVLTSSLIVLVFILPPESGEKVTFSISVFLSLAVLQGIVNNALPVTSDGISVLVLYI